MRQDKDSLGSISIPDHAGTLWHRDLGPHGGDLAILDQERAGRDGPGLGVDQAGVVDEYRGHAAPGHWRPGRLTLHSLSGPAG